MSSSALVPPPSRDPESDDDRDQPLESEGDPSSHSNSTQARSLSVTILDEGGVRLYNLETTTGDKELIAAPLSKPNACMSPTSFWTGASALFEGEMKGEPLSLPPTTLSEGGFVTSTIEGNQPQAASFSGFTIDSLFAVASDTTTTHTVPDPELQNADGEVPPPPPLDDQEESPEEVPPPPPADDYSILTSLLDGKPLNGSASILAAVPAAHPQTSSQSSNQSQTQNETQNAVRAASPSVNVIQAQSPARPQTEASKPLELSSIPSDVPSLGSRKASNSGRVPPPLPRKTFTGRLSTSSTATTVSNAIEPLVAVTISEDVPSGDPARGHSFSAEGRSKADTMTKVTRSSSRVEESKLSEVVTTPPRPSKPTPTPASAAGSTSTTTSSSQTPAVLPFITNPSIAAIRSDLVPIGSAAAAAAGSNASAHFIGGNISSLGIAVSDVKRVAHVTYDAETGKFSGVPEEWEGELKKSFGLPLQLSISRVVEGYESRLPPVLCELKSKLIELDGLNSEGIFRVSPNLVAANEARAQLDAGKPLNCSDPNLLAQLIKIWFREMPGKVLDTLPEKDVFACNTVPRAGEIVMAGREPHRTLLLWLLDLCCEVAEHGGRNLMSPKSLAIVLAPNLSRIADPGLEAPTDMSEIRQRMELCKLQTTFFECAIWWRMHNPSRPSYKPETAVPLPEALR